MVDSLPLSALLPSYDTSLRARGRSERTRHLAQTYCNRLVAWLEKTARSEHAADVSSRVLEEYFVHLSEELSSTTVGIHYRTVRAFFGWMAVEEEIDKNLSLIHI